MCYPHWVYTYGVYAISVVNQIDIDVHLMFVHRYRYLHDRKEKPRYKPCKRQLAIPRQPWTSRGWGSDRCVSKVLNNLNLTFIHNLRRLVTNRYTDWHSCSGWQLKKSIALLIQIREQQEINSRYWTTANILGICEDISSEALNVQ